MLSILWFLLRNQVGNIIQHVSVSNIRFSVKLCPLSNDNAVGSHSYSRCSNRSPPILRQTSVRRTAFSVTPNIGVGRCHSRLKSCHEILDSSVRDSVNVEYSTCPRRKELIGVRSGDRGGYAMALHVQATFLDTAPWATVDISHIVCWNYNLCVLARATSPADGAVTMCRRHQPKRWR
jgi:hypothetical protein